MSRDRDDELADLLDDLADTLRRLEEEVGPGRSRRGPLGLPAPPSPRDVLAFTGEYAIPTAIAILKANVRILELLGALLRAGASADGTRERGSEAVDKLWGETTSQLERALAEIQEAIEEGDLPRTPAARDVVEEARRLNADLREYVREADETVEEERRAERQAERRTKRQSDRGTSIPIEDGDGEDGGGEDDDGEDAEDGSVEIDVEEELRTIKEGMGESEDNDADDADDVDSEDGEDDQDDADADGGDGEDGAEHDENADDGE